MPNYCYNDLTVVGPKKDIIELREKEIDFEYFYPTPDNIAGDEIINWRTAYWGTKWSACDLYIKDTTYFRFDSGRETELIDNNILEAKFNTAWGPPVQFFRHYLRDHPECRIKLQFTVVEMDISGIVILEMKDGEIVEKSLDWECFNTFSYNYSDSDSEDKSD